MTCQKPPINHEGRPFLKRNHNFTNPAAPAIVVKILLRRLPLQRAVSSGCIRMRNVVVVDLYARVKIGTKVVVV